MMEARSRLSKFLFLILAISAVLSGCASFPGKELPTYTSDQIPTPEKKLASTFDAKAFAMNGNENKRLQPMLEEEIRKILIESKVFAQLDANKTDGEYHLSFVFRNEGNEVLAFLSGFISGLTFTVVPAYARDIFVLTVDVKQDGEEIKTYSYRDHMNSWIQGLLLVVTPVYWPPTVAQAIIDNMIMNFAHDFSKDIREGLYTMQATENGMILSETADIL